MFGGTLLDNAQRGKSLAEAWRADKSYDDPGEFDISGNVLNIHMKYDGSKSARDMLYIEPVFDITKNANKGNISLELKSLKAWGNSIADKILGAVSEYNGSDVPKVNEETENMKKKIFFVIGQKSYMKDGKQYDMDAESYIDANNRTMVPIRYVANALGVDDSGISYDNNTRIASIKFMDKDGFDTTVSILIGNNAFRVHKQNKDGMIANEIIPMDTVSVNRAGRIYVPARYIAEALGADVVWNQANNTVEIFN